MKLSRFLGPAICMVALLTFPTSAQEADPTAVPDAQDLAAHSDPVSPPARPAMWKIADDDTTIWLFGTIHLLPDTIDWRSGPVDAALGQADELVTEIDMTPEALARIASLMIEKGTLPEGETLRGLMDDDQRARFEAGLARLGMPVAALDKFEPWLAALVLLQTALAGSGYTDDLGAEKVLEASVGQGSVRSALESADFQIEVFDGMPMDQQLAFLMSGAEDPLAAIGMLGELVDLWAAGDVDRLATAMNEALLSHPALADRMLYSRNADWAAWIDRRLEAPGTVFMAVGAGHLAGDMSVQDYLAKHEIAVVRVQ